MNPKLAAIAANPLTYVVGLALCGAVSVVAGVGVIAGAGWALVSAGVFLLAASAFVIAGMKSNG